MDDQVKARVSGEVLKVVRSLQTAEDEWVMFAKVGSALSAAGINYKEYGFQKLRPFMNSFEDILEYRDEVEEGKTPVCFVRPKTGASSTPTADQVPVPAVPAAPKAAVHEAEKHVEPTGPKYPNKDIKLFQWASIPKVKIAALAELALEEKWYYGSTPKEGEESLPILRNYLTYTFKRLCFEKKIKFSEDEMHKEEYAAFNTGLVDKKYEYIYALFRKNTIYPVYYWFLVDFVVAGEDKGKTLIKYFNPLPERADYFENKIQNMLYDSSTGDLSCDYIHIITERVERLPKEFLEDNCPAEMLEVDGMSLAEACAKHLLDPARKRYFENLGSRIKNNPRTLNRLKNRISDAVELALKRVEWNYKTAIPMYYPTMNTGSLLLPLCLVEEDHVDLALVVERQVSGAYQGQTILPLNMAYSNSRLVTRPDSDWLKTDAISNGDDDDLDEDE